MEVIEYADGLRDRDVSFSLFRTALHQNDLRVGQGWEKSIESLAGYVQGKFASKYAEGLSDIYRDLTLYGTKYVKMYRVGGHAKKLAEAMSVSFVKKDSIYKPRFPLPLEKSELIKAPLSFHAVAKWEDAENPAYVLCSKQYVQEREELPKNSLNDDVVNDFGEFDTVYGLRKRGIQLFDIVMIDVELEMVEIRMDGISQQNVKDIEKRLKFILNNLKDFAAEKVSKKIKFEAINFYPCIKKLYLSPDGRIGQLGHSTNSAAVHTGKMRQKALDFRRDQYHAQGVKAIADLNAHMLGKRWDSPTKHGTVELVIPGTLSDVGAVEPVIDSVFFVGCASLDDYLFVKSKLMQAL